MTVVIGVSQPLPLLPSQLPQPEAHARPHVPIAQIAVERAPEAHPWPQLPHDDVLVRRSTSQPFVALPSQLPNEALHTNEHMPLLHVADALGRAGHTRPHPPQFDTLVRVSTQLPPHTVSPDAHPLRHVPPEQTCVAEHAFPQRPQLALDDASSTSHPLAGLLSQSAKPALQVPTAQRPPTHAGIPLAIAHAVAHPPQCAASVCVFDSQPLAALMSQSAKPALHAPNTHAPPTQDALALLTAHTLPHAPQFAALVRVSASQPFAGWLSQSAKPSLHAPIEQ